MAPMNLCGPTLKHLRLEHYLTLIDLKAKLEVEHGLLIHRTNLGRIENVLRAVSDIELVAFAKLFGVPLGQLLPGIPQIIAARSPTLSHEEGSHRVYISSLKLQRESVPRGAYNLCGPHLKHLRLERYLTLADLQTRIAIGYELSIDRTNLGRIENGLRMVRDIELVAFAHLFGVSLEQMLPETLP